MDNQNPNRDRQSNDQGDQSKSGDHQHGEGPRKGQDKSGAKQGGREPAHGGKQPSQGEQNR